MPAANPRISTAAVTALAVVAVVIVAKAVKTVAPRKAPKALLQVQDKIRGQAKFLKGRST